MLKAKRREWLTLALCLVAAMMAVSFFLPLYGEICEKNEYTGYKDCATYHVAGYFIFFVGQWLDRHSGAVAAIATAFIGAFTYTLYKVGTEQGRLTREAIELSRNEFISTHRPRIILREALVAALVEGQPISVFIHLANVGETDGQIIRSYVNVEIVSVTRLLLHPSVEMKDDLGQIALGPGAAHLIPYKGNTPTWDKEKFKELSFNTTSGIVMRRNFYIHLVGQFIYVDGAGIMRRTAFRRELIPERQRFYRIEGEPDLDYAD